MDPQLLNYYDQELQYIREMGGEFAEAFPKIAGRLGLDSFECADPYVERLLEGFAFLSARVHLKMDAEFPRFTQHLLDIVYPDYLAPTPSMGVVRFEPDVKIGNLADGFTLPRHATLYGTTGPEDKTACTFRTAHDVNLWPLEVASAEYFSRDTVSVSIPAGVSGVQAGIRLTLRATGGFRINQLALDRLPIFLRGREETPVRLYEQFFANLSAVVVRAPGADAAHTAVLDSSVIQPMGLDDDQSLIPVGLRSFQGYRLLSEYFACHQRFLFANVTSLKSCVQRCDGTELELVFLFDRLEPRLEHRIDGENFGLFCTPVINLFHHLADPIQPSRKHTEYHLVPDRTRPVDLEVFQVTRAIGRGAGAEDDQEFVPLYSLRDFEMSGQRPGYYTIHRIPRVKSARQQLRGPRSSYLGSEVYLSFADPENPPFRRDLQMWSVEVLCTNRDLPLLMPVGKGVTDFTLQTGGPIKSARFLTGPTRPHPPLAFLKGDLVWRLINHLSLNYLSLADRDRGGGATALRSMLTLYSHAAEPHLKKQVEGVRAIRSQPITRRLPTSGPTTIGRGLEIAVTFDEEGFEGIGEFLLATVLERFFSKYVSINSFTEMVSHSTQRGEIKRWPMNTGQRHLL